MLCVTHTLPHVHTCSQTQTHTQTHTHKHTHTNTHTHTHKWSQKMHTNGPPLLLEHRISLNRTVNKYMRSLARPLLVHDPV